MFFRRVFSRKEEEENEVQKANKDMHSNVTQATNRATNSNPILNSPYHSMRRGSMPNDDKQQRNSIMVQLTPLWETIIRTKRLPDNLSVNEIFDEFADRLRDPEWQVRQHALKVLVDVLIVMADRSDQYFQPLICPLVENLGHSAPAVRKGALDALKVYMTETAMPETIILEIISVGMEQKTFSEQYDGRVCVGVMLSMPSLVYTAMGTPKQSHIVRAVVQALSKKMLQVQYQEVALKVLLRIREMIGVREFSDRIAHNAYRDFELLCNVYGLPSTPNTQDLSSDLYLPQTSAETSRAWNPASNSTESNNCKVKRTELVWRDKQDETSADEENNNNNNSSNLVAKSSTVVAPKPFSCNGSTSEKGYVQTISVIAKKPDNEKVIMETEIQIQDTAVTMRIMEANSNSSENEIAGENSEDDLSSVNGAAGQCQSAVVRVLSDSDDSNGTIIEALDSARNPLKRVTFGGEEVKLRTPDSDSVLQSDNDDAQRAIQQIVEHKLGNSLNSSLTVLNGSPHHIEINGSPRRHEKIASPRHTEIKNQHQFTNESNKFLTASRPKTASIVITTSSPPVSDNEAIKSHRQRHKSASPIKRNRRPSYSSTDELIVSPRGSHSGIEVLHNLQQRSPNISPTRSRRNSTIEFGTTEKCENSTSNGDSDKNASNKEMLIESAKSNEIVVEEISSPEASRKNFMPNDSIKSWEDLGLVDELCLRNLKSGVSQTPNNILSNQFRFFPFFRAMASNQPFLSLTENPTNFRRILFFRLVEN